jgi:hypothetical protein
VRSLLFVGLILFVAKSWFALGRFGGCLGVGSFLALLISGKTLDQGEWSLLVGGIDGEVIIAQFRLIYYAAEMLLLVVLSDGKLIIADIVPFEG